ncbi:hypothetical protein CDL12_05628 [Handroanthus impetiginosus]|uniref:Late embryogenesis abundant protein LEA-2 subgroup domain-containing protein n=1 Tax=Handroanthus impetiginosus TaxID=429701 RepID=A0A2G9HWG2_9LAMI|nr:hypothetical protein CDL12_05628 [Handroanthus impetiginosus]
MADEVQVQQSTHPLASPNTYPRSDTEALATAYYGAARDHRKKTNRKKCLLYILLFLLFQTGIILLFTLTVLKIKSPKFRIHSATLHNVTTALAPESPSLNLTIHAELAVQNPNFGRFKFEKSYMNLFCRGMEVGRVLIPKGLSNWRSTEKFEVIMDLKIDSGERASDLSAGVVPINSRGKLRGNVRFMMAWTRKRSSDMNCSMDVLVSNREIKNIVC